MEVVRPFIPDQLLSSIVQVNIVSVPLFCELCGILETINKVFNIIAGDVCKGDVVMFTQKVYEKYMVILALLLYCLLFL